MIGIYGGTLRLASRQTRYLLRRRKSSNWFSEKIMLKQQDEIMNFSI